MIRDLWWGLVAILLNLCIALLVAGEATAPGTSDALITSTTVPHQPPAETVEPPTQQPDA